MVAVLMGLSLFYIHQVDHQMVVYTVMSPLTHMMVVLLMHLLEAVLEHRAVVCGKEHSQEDSTG